MHNDHFNCTVKLSIGVVILSLESLGDLQLNISERILKCVLGAVKTSPAHGFFIIINLVKVCT